MSDKIEDGPESTEQGKDNGASEEKKSELATSDVPKGDQNPFLQATYGQAMATPSMDPQSPAGGSSSLTFRSEASWPLRYPLHMMFDDHFPKLQGKLTSVEPNEHGNFIYHFGFCDFDSQDDADKASERLKNICDSLSTAVASQDKTAMIDLRRRLEAHLCYWKKNPISQPPIAQPTAPLGTHQAMAALQWDNSSMRNPAISMSTTPSKANDSGDNNPLYKTGRWSDAEHQQFLDLMTEHGRSWTQIAAKMPSRSEPQVRSHAQKYFLKQSSEKKVRKGSKRDSSCDEDEDLDGTGKSAKRNRRSVLQTSPISAADSYAAAAAAANSPGYMQQLVQNVRVFDQFGLTNSGFLNVAHQAPQAALLAAAAAGLATSGLSTAPVMNPSGSTAFPMVTGGVVPVQQQAQPTAPQAGN